MDSSVKKEKKRKEKTGKIRNLQTLFLLAPLPS